MTTDAILTQWDEEGGATAVGEQQQPGTNDDGSDGPRAIYTVPFPPPSAKFPVSIHTGGTKVVP